MNFKSILTDKALDKGSHHSPQEGACVMEKVAMLWALHEGRDVLGSFSDLPECTNPVIAKAAQAVNDNLSDEARQKLNAFIPRLLRARRTDSDRRVNVRLAVFSARYVLDLVDKKDLEVCERAIEAAEAWLEDPSDANATAATNAAYAAYAAANAAYAAYANAAATAAYAAAATAATAAYAAATTTTAAYAANATAGGGDYDPLTFLDALLDAWEEAVTKEGEDLYVPRAWEDDALAFVSEYMTDA
jgi:hypothetical protein